MRSLRTIFLHLIILGSMACPIVQAQNIAWQKCFGGSGFDYAYSSQQTSDDGYILCGITDSNDGTISGYHGGDDFWVEKLDAEGNQLWQKCLGGSGMDYGWAIQQTTDGNYIVAGSSNSNDGNVAGNHGDYDAWVVKLDTSGNVIWQKCLGGTGTDEAYSIQQTLDGGYILIGITNSTDGNVTGNHGAYDFWVVKLDASGNLVWQNCLGGSNDDFGHYGIQTSEGGYIITGATDSNDGNITGNHGNRDLWLVKLDANGNLLWQECLGGSAEDGGSCIQQTTEGGLILLGYTQSNDGDVSGNHGSVDFWVVKMGSTGDLTWQECLGGNGMEWPRSIQQTPDGGYLLAGSEGSDNNGNISGDHGGGDGWIVKLDPSGDLSWQKCLGGSLDEEARAVHQTSDGGYFVSGYTFSNDGQVSGNHGNCDAWAVKLTGTLPDPVFSPAAGISVLPVPFTILAAPGSTIHYTTDGSVPDCNSTLSGMSPLTLLTPDSCGTYVFKAIACMAEWASSGVTTGTYHIVPTGIPETTDGQRIFIVYPNPSSGYIHLDIADINGMKILLTNSTGQTVPCKAINPADSTIDISGIPAGIYLLRISGISKKTGEPVSKIASIIIK